MIVVLYGWNKWTMNCWLWSDEGCVPVRYDEHGCNLLLTVQECNVNSGFHMCCQEPYVHCGLTPFYGNNTLLASFFSLNLKLLNQPFWTGWRLKLIGWAGWFSTRSSQPIQACRIGRVQQYITRSIQKYDGPAIEHNAYSSISPEASKTYSTQNFDKSLDNSHESSITIAIET